VGLKQKEHGLESECETLRRRYLLVNIAVFGFLHFKMKSDPKTVTAVQIS
jgi:hypothetical protein